jgi:hypothetical protein
VRLDPLHLLVPLIIAAVAVLVLALDTSAGMSCDDAQKHFKKGQVEQAQRAVQKILDQEPDSSCASMLSTSMKEKVRDQKCADARHALVAHMLSPALKGFRELLDGNPTSDCGTKGVKAVIVRMCDRAAVLAKHEAGEAAHAAYTAILAIEPQPVIEPCPAAGLKSAPSSPGEPKTIVIQGVDGKNGTDGAPGAPGKPGTDGAPGAPGKPGKDGAPGKDGSRGPPGPPGHREVIVVDGKG